MSAPAAPPSVHTTGFPAVDEAEAAALMRHAFGIEGTARPLSSERDRNFHIAATDGRAFVLKIGNSAEDASIGDFQASALRHIAERAPHLPIPAVLPARNGSLQIVAEVAAGTRHVIRVLSFLPGALLHTVAATPRQTANLGRCLASLGMALRDFRHPAADHDLLWDLRSASRLRPALRHIAEDGPRRLAEQALDRFDTTILPRLTSLRRQVVHNDFNPHNVLVDPLDPARVTGVLDFGDMVDTQLVNDVAVAAAYQAAGPDPLDRVATFVASYHATNPLRAEEVDVLFDLIILRQVMTLAISAWRVSVYPENRSYILRNQPRAARALEHLGAIGHTRGRLRLREACSTATRA